MNNSLRKISLRILEISYKNNLSHIGSCMTAAPIIYDIYNAKKRDDIFILSSGHAYLAQLVVMEHFNIIQDAEKVFLEDGTHPKRNLNNGVHLSTGSLGMGLPCAVGFALANIGKSVYCLLSDGEMAEGSIWESLYFFDKLHKDFISGPSLKIYINANGYSAIDQISFSKLRQKLEVFKGCNINLINNTDDYIFYSHDCMKGLESHYHILNKEEYAAIREYYTKL